MDGHLRLRKVVQWFVLLGVYLKVIDMFLLFAGRQWRLTTLEAQLRAQSASKPLHAQPGAK